MKNLLLCFSITMLICSMCACKQPVKNDKIKNGIEIYEDGLHAEQAFLTNGDSTYINDDNKVQVGERVCLRLVVNGWKEKNDKVFMDASQKVTTGSGVALTENPSIFGIKLMLGTLPEDAHHVLLYQTIGRLDKPGDYILISFKVWDKTTKKSLSGSYKLYL
ncbi:MAG: hypothetical protein ABJA35_16365 [Parafilimonas sp.]